MGATHLETLALSADSGLSQHLGIISGVKGVIKYVYELDTYH